MKLSAAALAVGALAAASALAHGGHEAPPAPPGKFEPPAPGSYALPVIDRVSDHTLLGVDGPAPLLGLAKGELALVSFVYLSCGESCPLATALLARLDGEIAQAPDLRGRVVLDTVSFDPARDTPDHMRELRDRLAPRGRWRFLTAANAAALRPVLLDFGQDAVWIPGEEGASDSLRHVLKVFVVDSRGGIRQIYSTGFLDARLVLADLRTLLPSAP
jgi:cytochrome oxidase Cu insertion factor (SCO1/SenC/PrrC family)